MTQRRHFLGVEEPLAEAVGKVLRGYRRGRDLGHVLVVTGTRQAGRRLRETLAAAGGETGGVLAPRVVTPHQVVQPDPSGPRAAGPLLVRAVWADALLRADLSRFPHLFPADPSPSTYRWALRMGKALDGLRNHLLEADLGLREVAERFAERLPEPGRWRDLAALEKAYLDALRRLDRRDPCVARRQAARSPILPEDVAQVIVAATPDLTPLVQIALESLARRLPVDVLVHAPAAWAHAFDPWGRPLPSVWEEMTLPIPEHAILLAGDEEDQCRMALDALRSREPSDVPRSAGLAAPDRTVAPVLMRRLAEAGIEAFDPAPQPIAGHRIVRLLDSLAELASGGSYASGARLLRHPDVLTWLHRGHGVRRAALLESLDRWQNRTLPQTFRDLVAGVRSESDADAGLRAALQAVEEQVRVIQRPPAGEGLLRVLETIYSPQTLDPRREEDERFMRVAREVTSALSDGDHDALAQLRLSVADRLRLLVDHLRGLQLNPERGAQALDIEGWLELPWHDAPLLVITGFNEGIVPESVQGDAFLSDAVRQELGLRHNRDRFARDAFLLQSLIAARPAGGVRLILGKTNRNGDPLQPSRLLFRCDDDALAQRARRLFGEPEAARPTVPATVSFPLDPSVRPGESLMVDSLPVTAFGEYLTCPFRFYLRRILGMESLDDRKEELNALDFGMLVHAALHAVFREGPPGGPSEAEAMAESLARRAEEIARGRWGPDLPLPVRIQLLSAQQRLRAVARLQAEWRCQGWETLAVECRIEGEINGLPVTGQIDRVDRHRDSGRIRILDYKTSERAVPPAKVHVGSIPPHAPSYAVLEYKQKSRAWRGLQLPLYAMLWGQQTDHPDAPVELGYVHLPKAVQETDVETWSEWNDALLSSARRCAAGIVGDIRAGRFWPPADRVDYDEFAALFPGPAADYVNPERFLRTLPTALTPPPVSSP